MATFNEIIMASQNGMGNRELAEHYNPDAVFANNDAARGAGHVMKIRAQREIDAGNGNAEYQPIRQRNGGTATAVKPAKGKAVMASSIDDVPLRTLICQAVTVASMTYQGEVAMDTTRNNICAHLEAQTPCLMNAMRVMSPLMGIDPDDAIIRLSEWAGVRSEEEKKAERCRALANRLLAAHTAAKLNEQTVERLIKAGFEVNAPNSHCMALRIDSVAVELAVKHADESSLETMSSGIL